MKVSVWIPSPLFADAEDLAKRMMLSRSELYTKALDAFVAKHAPNQLAEQINAALEV